MTPVRAYAPAVGLALFGAALNLSVVVANGGVMPVAGAPAHIEFGRSLNGLVAYEHAAAGHSLMVLADRWSLAGASLGDIAVFAGLLLIITTAFLRRRSP